MCGNQYRRKRLLNPMVAIRLIAPAALIIALAAGVSAQKSKPAAETQPPSANPAHVLASAAYAEVSLRYVEVSAEIDAMLEDYTENHPSVLKARLVRASLTADNLRMRSVKPEDAGKLTAALGKTIVRKAELLADYKSLERQYPADSAEVRRAKKRYEYFAAVVDEILGR